jgi:hypothetical protein
LRAPAITNARRGSAMRAWRRQYATRIGHAGPTLVTNAANDAQTNHTVELHG